MLELDTSTIIFAIVDFIILVCLLRLFLYKPILSMLDKRRQAVNDALDQAERSRALAAETDAQLEARSAAARLEAESMVAAAREQAATAAAAILEQARQEAADISAKALADIERQKEQALTDVRSQIADLALAAAEKAISGTLTEQQQQTLLDSFVEQVEQV